MKEEVQSKNLQATLVETPIPYNSPAWLSKWVAAVKWPVQNERVRIRLNYRLEWFRLG